MLHRGIFGGEKIDSFEQVFESQQRADTFIEGVFITDHGEFFSQCKKSESCLMPAKYTNENFCLPVNIKRTTLIKGFRYVQIANSKANFVDS